jgi:membrane fusion protein (multidrug efflux system)
MKMAARIPVRGRRRGVLVFLFLVFVAAGVGWAVWWQLVGRWYESTDNAYVAGHIVQVTPQIAGTVVAIGADDTDRVQAGQVLVRLDPADAQVALGQAEAQLAQAVREVRTLYTRNASLEASQAQRASELAKAEEDLARRAPLAGTGAVSKEDVEHARNAVEAARAALAAAREDLVTNRVRTEGTAVAKHPGVAAAAARVRDAFLALQRTEIAAPVAGYVARRTVQAGQRVAPGALMMAVVPLDSVWIDANFKEVQLRDMRIGQPVKLTADLYGNRTEYSGKVAGLSAGTGGAFALLPPQNATGNWIKVVQRLPVRIALDPGQLAAHPLLVGLSMHAEVSIRDTSGAQLAATARANPVWAPAVLAKPAEDAEARVQAIIAANLGAVQRR